MTSTTPEAPDVEPTQAPMQFQVDADPTEQSTALVDSFPFQLSKKKIDGTIEDDVSYVYTCVRPKAGWWIKMMRATQNGAADLDKMTFGEQVALVEHFMQVLPPADRERLRDKFEDEDSSWDYDMLVPVVKAAQERWFGRPTGRSAVPSRTRPTTGKSSTAKPRSAAQTRARSPKNAG